MSGQFIHPRLNRRQAIQAGGIGLLGLSTTHLERLRAETGNPASSAKNVIYIFLSGGLGQHDSFDPKPNASEEIRGEFKPIATKTTGLHICEHLPKLANRSDKWALVRSLTHPYNEHSQGHMAMLTGRTPMPVGFSPASPKPGDHPSIASVVGATTTVPNNLPPAIILPEKLVHRSGREIPGQFAGVMGPQRAPYLLDCCKFNGKSYGAWPKYGFHHQRGGENPAGYQFSTPSLVLPEGLTQQRLGQRVDLLNLVERQQHYLRQLAEVETFDRFQERAVAMLSDGKMKGLFNVAGADPKTLDR